MQRIADVAETCFLSSEFSGQRFARWTFFFYENGEVCVGVWTFYSVSEESLSLHLDAVEFLKNSIFSAGVLKNFNSEPYRKV